MNQQYDFGCAAEDPGSGLGGGAVVKAEKRFGG